MRLPRKRGSTSNMVRVFVPDSTSTTGAGLTGLTSSSTNLVVAYCREFDSSCTTYSGANVETVTTIGTYQAPSSSSKVRFKAVDVTNLPGTYELHFHDSATAFGSADSSAHVIVNLLETSTTALHIGPCQVMIPLVPWDPQDGTRLGLTAMPNAAAGASGGLLISGSNSGTTTLGALTVTGATTLTGNVSMAAGLTVAQSTTNGDAVSFTGNGAGYGHRITGGSTSGVALGLFGAGTGYAIYALGGATNAHGAYINGQGAGNGVVLAGGPTGGAASLLGGSTSGPALSLGTMAGDTLVISPVGGHGVVVTANGTSKHGLFVTGGTGGTSDGAKFVAGTGGVDVRGNITGNLAGTVSTLTTYTGNTPQSGDNYARIGAAGAGLTALGDARLAHLDADVSSRSTYAGGAVASVTAAVTLSAGDSPVVATGTAAAGGASTITLQTALGADSLVVGCVVKITSGTGAKQERVITGYVDSTKVVTVGRPWAVVPDNTSVYAVLYDAAPRVDSSLQVTAASVQGNVTGSVAGSVGSVAGVTFPANFGALLVSAGGHISNVDTLTTWTGATPQTGDCYARLGAPAGASIAADLAEIEAETDAIAAIPTNPYTGTPPTTAAIAAAVWQDLLAGADFGTAGSIGALLKLDVDATVSSRSTYGGADTAGTTTLLGRLPGTVQPQTGDAFARLGVAGAGLTALGDARLAHLDADVGTRLAAASYMAPPSAGLIAFAVLTDTLAPDLAAPGSLGHLVTTAPPWYTAPANPADYARNNVAPSWWTAPVDVSAGVAAVKADTGTLLTRLPSALTVTGGKVDVNDKTGFALAATGLDLVLVAGVPLPAAVRYVGASVAGKVSGAGTGAETFADFAGATALVITVDAAGDRTAISYQ